MAEADTVLTLKEVSVTGIKGGALANHDEAVTSLGENALRRLDVTGIKQASEIAPNFYIPAYGSRMTSTVYVRGLGARIDQPVVGLNIDNVPILNKDNYDFDLTDIARLEILRGPQNILYGRNTMGGLINVYTLSPLAWQGVRVRATYGNRNAYKASAAVYGQLAGGLGMGLNILATGTDGFYRNEFNDTPTGRERNWSARWKTAWRPAENVMVENAATLTLARQNGYPYQSAATGKISYNDTCYYRRTAFTDGLTVKHRFRDIDFSSIISFQYIDDDMTLDQDFLPVDYFTLTQARKEWGVTADFVARGGKGRYRWLGGVFGFGKLGRMRAPVTFGDYGISTLIEEHRNHINPAYPVRWDERSFLLGSDFTLPSGGASAYHESSLTLGDWNITVGLRFDWEHAAIRYHSHCNSSYTIFRGDPADGDVYRTDPVRIDNRGRLSKDFCQLLPKISVSYSLPGNSGNIYASATKGYKAGGYNTQMFSEVLQQNVMEIMGLNADIDLEKTISYDPEKNWTFE
ncbi:MAG: TonB-dependent receptor plug domain-containing protein, partial [Muribaculaceae bacterium]|nr:TonB-dependent receptor plug domain-containing protein [Muribaculaceae bacterium]